MNSLLEEVKESLRDKLEKISQFDEAQIERTRRLEKQQHKIMDILQANFKIPSDIHTSSGRDRND